MIAAGIFLLFTPAGPFVAFFAGVQAFRTAVQWFRDNAQKKNAVVDQRSLVQRTVIPTLKKGADMVMGGLRTAVKSVSDKLGAIAAGLAETAAGCTGVGRVIPDHGREVDSNAGAGVGGLGDRSAHGPERSGLVWTGQAEGIPPAGARFPRRDRRRRGRHLQAARRHRRQALEPDSQLHPRTVRELPDRTGRQEDSAVQDGDGNDPGDLDADQEHSAQRHPQGVQGRRFQRRDRRSAAARAERARHTARAVHRDLREERSAHRHGSGGSRQIPDEHPARRQDRVRELRREHPVAPGRRAEGLAVQRTRGRQH